MITVSAFDKPQSNNQRNKKYYTIFIDDFEELNRNVWTFHSQESPTYGGRYNSRFKTNEDNVYVENGKLVLDCSKTAIKNDGTYRKSNGVEAPVEYLAPYISTCDFFAMQEGRISAKIRVSKGIEDGVFPFCFWTFGQNSTWPYAHEMDIMEATAGVSQKNKFARNGTIIPAGSHSSVFAHHLFVRTATNNPLRKESVLKLNWALYRQGKFDRSIDFISKVDPTEWHIYTAEWNKDNITYYVDGKTIISYNAADLGAINAEGNIGFYYPQDIRFNIKAGEKTTDQHGYMYIDWVKAEALDNKPCISISHKDVVLKVKGSLFINPTFNEGYPNKAFNVEIEDDGILIYKKYLNDKSQMVVHKIIGQKAGETIVTLSAASGKVVSTFKVKVI